MANRPPSSADRERRALFAWLPSHRVDRSERQRRVESLLGHIPLFSGVPAHRLRAIAQLARRNRFSAGETVIRAGEMGSTMHIIRRGRVYVLGGSQGGSPVVLATLGPGEFFGELALFDRQPRSATVVAAEDSETLSLGRAEILDIISRYPEVALAFLGSIGARLRSADNLLENFTRNYANDAAPDDPPATGRG